MKNRFTTHRAFTLVEVLVVAPIIILSIGAFIALVVTLTGNTLTSRGSSVMQYDIQDSLDQIEDDIRRSAALLAVNDIPLSSTNPQGYLANPSAASASGSIVNFSNINKTVSGGSSASLILKQFATSANPVANGINVKYTADTPNSCSGNFKLNTPAYVNIIYFVANNTLWKRTITPSNYATSAQYCEGVMWQLPTCSTGTTHSYCKVHDTKLIENVVSNGFNFRYFNAADSSSVLSQATSPSQSDASRNNALALATTVEVDLEVTRSIAGKEVNKKGSIRATRLNSTSNTPKPTIPGAVSSFVFNGRQVYFSWQQSQDANIYDVEYRINGGSWQFGATLNNDYSYIVTANHNDTVEARVLARNTSGASPYITGSRHIPLWATLPLQNNWTNYEGGFTTAEYTRTSAGLVVIKGLIKNASAQANPSIIANLPADYAPTGRLMFGVSTSPNASARIDIGENGSIYFSDSGNIGWISMDSIRYIAANAGLSRTAMTLYNSFTNYGGVYATGSYVQDSSGRVSLQGLLAGGSRGNGNAITTLPAALRPAKYQHHASRSGTWHHLGLDVTYGLLAKGDGTGAYSINTSHFPASYTGWSDLSMTNSWTYYDGSSGMFSTPQYTKANDGVVHLKGLIRSGTIGTATPVATLPPGFRPAQRILSVTASNGGYARIDIQPTGEILATTGSNAWYSLDGISFIAEQ